MMMLLIFLVLPLSYVTSYPSFNLTWVVTDITTGNVISQTSQIDPPGTWFPDLYFDLRDLFPGRGAWNLRQSFFYMCPGTRKDEGCGGADDYYCKKWGCERSGDIWWPVTGDDLISVSRVYRSDVAYHAPRDMRCPGYPRCNPIKITFTEAGKRATAWGTGKTWGIRLYKVGAGNGALISIRLFTQIH